MSTMDSKCESGQMTENAKDELVRKLGYEAGFSKLF